MSHGLGGDAFTRNVTDGRTDFGTKLIYLFFLKKKAGIIVVYNLKMEQHKTNQMKYVDDHMHSLDTLFSHLTKFQIRMASTV